MVAEAVVVAETPSCLTARPGMLRPGGLGVDHLPGLYGIGGGDASSKASNDVSDDLSEE